MKTSKDDNEIVLFIKRFGIITNSAVILLKDNNQNSIPFESIKKIDLVKERTVLTNILFFCSSTILMSYIYFAINKNIYTFYTLLTIAVILFLLSIFIKFHQYTLTIKNKENKSFKIKTTELNKNKIKKFYFSIKKKTSRDEKLVI